MWRIGMYSLNNLRRRYSRTGLTVMGITLAISLMVIMFSIGNGVRDSARSILDEAGVDIFCQANGTSINFYLGEIDNGRDIASSMKKGNDDIRTAYPVFVHTMYGINESMRQLILTMDPTDIANMSTLAKKMDIEGVNMNGVIPELVGGLGGVEVLDGPGFTREDDPFYQGRTYAGGTGSPLFTHEIEINKVLADKLGLGIGDIVYLNNKLPSNMSELPSWLVNATSFKVVLEMQASWEGLGTSSGYVHLSELQFLAGKTNDTVHQILVDLHDPTKDKEVKAWIETNYPELEAFTIEDFLGEIGS
jgi:ABC-type lipoprotein release transport system permease subunit